MMVATSSQTTPVVNSSAVLTGTRSLWIVKCVLLQCFRLKAHIVTPNSENNVLFLDLANLEEMYHRCFGRAATNDQTFNILEFKCGQLAFFKSRGTP